MSAPPPMIFRWDDRARVMVPINPARAAGAFSGNEHYRLAPVEERSMPSHSHYFAALGEAFKNLPEALAENFVNFTHFRKWCLIRTGWRDETKIVAANHEEALTLAAFVRKRDDFCVVEVTACVVTIFVAKSQSLKEMGAADFKASKGDVLDYAAGLVGVAADDLRRNMAA